MQYEQMSLDWCKKHDVKLNKPIRLIELFAGYGSQNMALKRVGANYESWFVCENDKFAIKSYNAVHNSSHDTIDINNVHAEDLRICDTDKYIYFMTYSFPCTDISVAGAQKGFKKDAEKTRSGLLWQVERILNEIVDGNGNLPQVLMMENVKNIVSKRHKPDFDMWCDYLESIGYINFYQVMNAADYGIPQHRERCFMFSFLRSEFGSNIDYKFPEPVPLKVAMKDVLEENVDAKYYVGTDRAKSLIVNLIRNAKLNKECASSTE